MCVCDCVCVCVCVCVFLHSCHMADICLGIMDHALLSELGGEVRHSVLQVFTDDPTGTFAAGQTYILVNMRGATIAL